MINEDANNNDLMVDALVKILHCYWNKIVSGSISVVDREDIRQKLCQDTNDDEFSAGMSEFLANNGVDKFELTSERKVILTDAMVKEFLCEEYMLSDWVMLLIYWNVFDLFRAHVEKKLEDEEASTYIQSIRNKSIKVFDTLEGLLIGDERNRFFSSVAQWEKEENIQEFWHWGVQEWFTFDRDVFLIPELLLPMYPTEFLEVAGHLKHPMLLNELIAGIFIKGNTKNMLALMRGAPSSLKVDNEMQWNQSWVAPAVLDELFQMIVRKYPVHTDIDLEKEKDIQAFFSEVGEILRNRSDGLFLSWNYIRYLLSRENINRNVLKLFLNGIESQMYERAKGNFSLPQDFKEILSADLPVIRKEFQETGLLQKVEKKSVYLDILSWMHFFSKDDGILSDLLFYLETALMLKDDGIDVYEVRIKQCHYDVAYMYLKKYPENVIEGWSDTWKLFVMARYNNRFDYYDENSIILRKHLNFLLLVALALLQKMHQDNDFEHLKFFLQTLFLITEERLQYKFSYDDQFTMKFLQVLNSYDSRE